MSEGYAIEYEAEDILFEFAPASGAKGDLSATFGGKTVMGKVELPNPKSRGAFITECYELYPEEFALDELAFRRAMNDLATHVDEQLKIRAAKSEEDDEEEDDAEGDNLEPPPEPGTEEYEAAVGILESEDVLEEAAKTMLRLGHVGEWGNKKLAFLCAISARAQLPVQPSTHAQSSAGKNYLWDSVLALVPPELVYKKTGFSAKALFRTRMNLRHSILYIQELAGSEGADFSIRTLQSDNVLKWEATEKQPDGTLSNVEYEVAGPTVIVQTTTKNHLHPENETRVVPLYLDESSEQTEMITKEALRRAAGKGMVSETERVSRCAAWHDAIRLLEPAEVVLPYAERIRVPNHIVRIRRDVPRLLNIVRLVAWLHQRKREKDDQDRILATEEDFRTVVGVVGESFARAWKSLTPTEEKVYSAITEHVAERLRKTGFKRRHVEDALEKEGERVPVTSLNDALRALVGNGFLESDRGRGAAGATYTVAKSAGVMGEITLAPTKQKKDGTPPRNSAIEPKTAESGIGKGNPIAGSDFGNSRQSSNEKNGKGESPNCRKLTDDDSAIKDGLGKPKNTDFGGNCRIAEGSADEKETGGRVEYEYSEDQ